MWHPLSFSLCITILCIEFCCPTNIELTVFCQLLLSLAPFVFLKEHYPNSMSNNKDTISSHVPGIILSGDELEVLVSMCG